jgi:predicted TIM-barrel fold metal-dependent hydrolase
VAIAYGGYSVVPSMIFEGVFDRFPTLKVVLIELGWSWAAPLAWRMDAAMRRMGDEVSHLRRLPSEYFADHFWLTTQPIDEPSRPEWIGGLFAQAESLGFGDKLLFSSDYPHWDFDSPVDALPSILSAETRAKVLGENAAKLYGIPLVQPDLLAA